jgi:hypothetical protein
MRVDSHKILTFGEIINQHALEGCTKYSRALTKRSTSRAIDGLSHPIIQDHVSNQSTPRFAVYLENATPYLNGAIIKNKDNEIIKSPFLHHQHNDHAPWSWYERYSTYELSQPTKMILGNTLYLSDIWWESYYHFQVDILGKMLVALSFYPLVNYDYIILPNTPPSYVLEILEILGIIHKIRIEPKEPVTYSQLTIPSYCASGDGYIPIELVRFLQDNVAKNISNSKEKSKIYISRKNAGWRRVINEELLEPILKKAGFKILCNENMSVKEQIVAFSNASTVISPHGAGLTNLIYCNAGTRVFEVFSESYIHKCYAELAGEMELDYHYAVFKNPPQSPKDILLDINVLDKFLT